MKVVGRYAVFDEIARGGMASVHVGRLLGAGGFSRTVAVKRLHPHLARDGEFLAMLLDEARLVSRIQHPNVVSVLDVVADEEQVAIVMEFVDGAPLSSLLKASSAATPVPPAIAVAIVVNALRGLHAAHEAVGEDGQPLRLVHRDVTPHNVMVRRDGSAVVLDFGVAKAAGRFHTTEEGKVKGKLPYMAPEQLRGQELTRRVDVYAAGAVLWETLVGRRLFSGANEGEVLEQVLFGEVKTPGSLRGGIASGLDSVVMRAIARQPEERFATAAAMADALETARAPALPSQVATWLEGLAKPTLDKLAARLREIESDHRADRSQLPERVRAALKRSAESDGPETEVAVVEASPVGGRTPPAIASTAATRVSLPEETGSISSGALAKAAAQASPRGGAGKWLALFVLVPAAAGAGWFAWSQASSASRSAPLPSAVTTAAAPAAPRESAPREDAPRAAASAAASAVTSAAEPAVAPPSLSAAATSRPARVAPRVPQPPPKTATPVDCVQIDAEGHKTYNRNCLK